MKKSIIRDISKKDSEVKKVINDMINDESIIKALKLGDIKTIENFFVDKMDNKIKNSDLVLGGVLGVVISFCIIVLLRVCKNGFDEITDIFMQESIAFVLLILFLGYSMFEIKDTIQEFEKIEKVEQLQKHDTTNVIDFCVTKMDFDDIENSDFRFKFEKNRDKAFKFYDSLSDEQKISLIYGILENNEKVKKVISDMMEDEDIIEAIKYRNNETVEEAFEGKMAKSLFDCILEVFLCAIVARGIFEKLLEY